MLENLVVAVESEAQVIDIGRVSGFMQKVGNSVLPLTVCMIILFMETLSGTQRRYLGLLLRPVSTRYLSLSFLLPLLLQLLQPCITPARCNIFLIVCSLVLSINCVPESPVHVEYWSVGVLP